jgi:hypothetical protein
MMVMTASWMLESIKRAEFKTLRAKIYYHLWWPTSLQGWINSTGYWNPSPTIAVPVMVVITASWSPGSDQVVSREP